MPLTTSPALETLELKSDKAALPEAKAPSSGTATARAALPEASASPANARAAEPEAT